MYYVDISSKLPVQKYICQHRTKNERKDLIGWFWQHKMLYQKNVGFSPAYAAWRS